MQDNDNEIETVDDETVEEVVEQNPTIPVKRPRGRPKGVKVGPRPRAWACAAIVDDELIHEHISAPDDATDEQKGSFSIAEAKALFTKLYGQEPDSVLGPFLDHKGGQNEIVSKKRETVSISFPALTMKRENAIYKGWRGVAYGIEGREDAVYFMFGDEVNPSDKKKSPPGGKPILRAALEFEKSNDSDETVTS